MSAKWYHYDKDDKFKGESTTEKKPSPWVGCGCLIAILVSVSLILSALGLLPDSEEEGEKTSAQPHLEKTEDERQDRRTLR